MRRPLALAIARAHRPWAKVCGLSRQTDLYQALEAGADFVGFVSFEPSPRHMSDAQIIALCGVVHDAGARAALVTVDRVRPDVDRLVIDAGLDAVQLCGEESPNDWKDTPYGLLRRIGVGEGCFKELDAWQGIADAFVLDHPASVGGSGQPVNMELAEELANAAPCFLAGGLDAEAAAFRGEASAPFIGFDASSRLESRPGAKDPSAVVRFVDAAHRYPNASNRESSL